MPATPEYYKYYNFDESYLMLCIENIDNKSSNKVINSRLFVFWNEPSKEFMIFFVKRQNIANSTCRKFFQCLSSSFVKTDTNTEKTDTNTEKTDIETFGYKCPDVNDLFTFIELIVGRKNKININLYIFSNFKAMKNIPTYDVMEEYIDKTNKVSSHNNTYLKKERMVNYFNMLKNLNNIF
jgi:hypothetical protein